MGVVVSLFLKDAPPPPVHGPKTRSYYHTGWDTPFDEDLARRVASKKRDLPGTIEDAVANSKCVDINDAVTAAASTAEGRELIQTPHGGITVFMRRVKSACTTW